MDSDLFMKELKNQVIGHMCLINAGLSDVYGEAFEELYRRYELEDERIKL